ncbi:hypothetical protein CAEBREN_31660 [Caenorhabditis brenneri]|uniref:Uncharacterized protein n=1 Tax=Caenorhabditis brenneri TaxID=135651 RepID=G0N7I4_CAEBE|nr:hypothetical protein CAEBREN_31660 [Caenorhabditis brenneri]
MMLQPPKLENHSSEDSESTGRSSESPSNIDDLMEDDVNQKDIDEEEDLLDAENELEMTARVKKLESNLVFIMHQLTSIMTHLHVKGCECTTCIHVKQKGAAKKESAKAPKKL